MNCPQCNTSLPDSATYCFKCGASTRPASFSYLPAGVPAWPTTAPESHYYGPDAPTDAFAFQEGKTALAPGAGAKGQAKSGRSARGIALLVTLLVLAPVIGVLATLGVLYANGSFAAAPTTRVHVAAIATPGASATSTPAAASSATTNQLPTPTSFQTASVSQVGITLKYPSDWVAGSPQSSSSGVSVSFQPQQQLPIGLSVSKFSSSTTPQLPNTSVLNQSILQGFGSSASLTSMQTLTNTPRQSSIGGVSWDQQDATFATSSGQSVHAVSISVKHKNIYFNIFYFALAPEYGEAVQKYYSQMLASFQFLA
jgi:zinc-ribbon domain